MINKLLILVVVWGADVVETSDVVIAGVVVAGVVVVSSIKCYKDFASFELFYVV